MIRAMVKTLERFKAPIKMLPNLKDLSDGRVAVSQIRDLAVEDLLDRVPVGLDLEPARLAVRTQLGDPPEQIVYSITGCGIWPMTTAASIS